MSVKGKHLLHYVPHGIDPKVFKPVDKTDPKFLEMKKRIFKGKEYDYALFFNSRNINRKRVTGIILAFRNFCENLTEEQYKKCVLVLHTERVLDAGTDLQACCESMLGDKYNYIFVEERFPSDELNLLYNICDVNVNISSSEGFGLSVAESMMAGLVTIVNVTGGLQDQIGQTDDNGNPIQFTKDFGTNSEGKYRKHGVWTKPVWPGARIIQGSPMTPYLFDDLCKWEDVAVRMMEWYKTPKEERIKFGLEGRRWAMNEGGLNVENLANQFIAAIDYTLENFVPESSFSLHTDEEHTGNYTPDNVLGFTIPKINC